MSLYTEMAATAVERIRAAKTAKDVVSIYTELLLRMPTLDPTGWRLANGAILERWKPSTLNWIKREAWKAAH